MKKKDIAKAIGQDVSVVYRVLKGERGIPLSAAYNIQELLGGSLKSYIHKRGEEAEQIFNQISTVKANESKAA